MSVSMRSRRVRSVFLVIALLGAVLLSVGRTTPANAWTWSPTVQLNGKIGCNYATSNTVKWAWVAASDGESGWASLGSGGMTRPYSFTFHRAPGSMSVTVNWGCSIDGNHSTSFAVYRPNVGTTATRNICYWRPCLL